MTEETAQIFDAPWKVDEVEYKHSFFDFQSNTIRVFNKKEELVTAFVPDKSIANRISHLPELYDALMWATVQYCPDAFLSLDECRLCGEKKCKGRECVELLRKLRNGE